MRGKHFRRHAWFGRVGIGRREPRHRNSQNASVSPRPSPRAETFATSRRLAARNSRSVRKQGWWRSLVRAVALCTLGTGLAAMVALIVYLSNMLRGLPSVTAETFTNRSVSSCVVDKHGRVIGWFTKEGDRQPIQSLHEVTPVLIHSFIAAEDKSFYHNVGIAPIAMVRAAVQDLMGHGIHSGASTITQQTVKLAVFPEQERTMKRKIQEIALALQVNRMLSKDEIMTDYMNWVYMGRMGAKNVYGVKMASKTLFHRPPNRLNLPQATFLAAIPNNPSYFSPYAYPSHTVARQHYILKQMLQNHVISDADYSAAMHYPILRDLAPPPTSTWRYPYVMSRVEAEVAKEFVQSGIYATLAEADAALATAGYRIETTIDLDLQNRMDASLSRDKLFRNTTKSVKGKSQSDLYQVGAMIVDNGTGGIAALDGGRPNHYLLDQVDHTDSPRAPGSTIKPLVVYGPAIESGALTAGTLLDDGPGIFNEGLPWQYEPKDDVPYWHGFVTVREALVQSLNLPAVRAMNQIQPEVGMSYLDKLGIHSGDTTRSGLPTLVDEDTHHLASAVGGLSHGLTLEQLTGAYTVFPNEGIWRKPILISRISDAQGSLVYQDKPVAERVFSRQTAAIMTSILHDATAKPTGTAYDIGRRFRDAVVAGKTGTTDRQEDGWFIGYTPQYTAGIWMGYNHNERIPTRVYRLKFRLWNDIMEPSVRGRESWSEWSETHQEGLKTVEICRKSGLVATEACRESGGAYGELFMPGTEPTRTCDVHQDAGDEAVTGDTSSNSLLSNEPPTIDDVTATMDQGGVLFTFKPVSQECIYSLWRSSSANGPMQRVGLPSPFPTFIDANVPHGWSTAYYEIHAKMADGSSIPSRRIRVDFSTKNE